MTLQAERAARDTAARPFRIDIPEADLEDLRARIAATRWPEKEGVEDTSQGVQLATIQAVARYWEAEHDWRKCEAKLNVRNVSVPVAVSVFPDELFKAPRSWAERAYPNLIHSNEMEKGGHFAAWEQPDLYASELRTGLRTLR